MFGKIFFLILLICPIIHSSSFENEKLQRPLNFEFVLKMTPKEFKEDTLAHKVLFLGAIDESYFFSSFLRDVQSKLFDTNLSVTIKACDAEELAELIIKKLERKDAAIYPSIGKLHDIVRARIDFKNELGIEREFQTIINVIDKLRGKYGLEIIQTKAPVKTGTLTISSLKDPREEVVRDSYDYPRYHLKIGRKLTGLIFELQIGPRQVSRYFQTGTSHLKIEPGWQMSSTTKPNLHDVYYKIFMPIFTKLEKKQSRNEPEDKVYYDIGFFFRKFSSVMAIAGHRELPEKNFDYELGTLHFDACELLATIVETMGPEFIKSYQH